MKTRVILLACVALLCLPYRSLQGQVNFGVKAGMNLETRSELGQLWDNDEVCSGFIVGGTIEYALNSTLSLQTEVNFVQKGERYSTQVNGIDADIRKEFNYITVPLLVKGTFNDELELNGNWNIYGFTGPYLAYLVSAKNHVDASGSAGSEDITGDSVRDDWGVILGGGVSYNLNNGNAVFSELRYDMGLGKIDNDNNDLRNKAISLCVGFSF